MLVKVQPQDSESQTNGLSPGKTEKMNREKETNQSAVQKDSPDYCIYIHTSVYLCDYEDGF